LGMPTPEVCLPGSLDAAEGSPTELATHWSPSSPPHGYLMARCPPPPSYLTRTV
jgi:hypothetical protein